MLVNHMSSLGARQGRRTLGGSGRLMRAYLLGSLFVLGVSAGPCLAQGAPMMTRFRAHHDLASVTSRPLDSIPLAPLISSDSTSTRVGHIRRGAAIGGAIGAGIGIIASAAVGGGCDDGGNCAATSRKPLSVVLAGLGTAAVGAAIGAAVGAVIPSHR